jgi:protein-S-isoprenylcysteine O-methyltransferase Ste14
MVTNIVLCITLLLVLLVITIVIRSLIQKISVIGRTPIPVFFFILAKALVFINLCFLLMEGFNIKVYRLFQPLPFLEIISLVLLALGTIVLIITTFQLNKDLIFGLSDSPQHKLQTNGVYSISRHPFYLGFIFILFSSCLLYPNPLNIISFLGAWIIHHFIMIKEEQFLESVYGEEYRQYMQKVNRYLTLK